MYRKWMLSSRGLDIAVILGYNPKNSLASPRRSRNAVAWESLLVAFPCSGGEGNNFQPTKSS